MSTTQRIASRQRPAPTTHRRAGVSRAPAPVRLQARSLGNQAVLQRAKGIDVAVYETTDHGTGYEDAPSETYKVKANSLDEAGTKVEALVKMTAMLGNGSAIRHLAFYGHASPGNQSVGAGEMMAAEKEISSATLAAYPAKFKKIYTPLADGASVFLRGCNAGAGAAGLKTLQDLKSSAKSEAAKDITAYGWTGTSYHERFLGYDSYSQTGQLVSSNTKQPKMTWEKLKKLKKKSN